MKANLQSDLVVKNLAAETKPYYCMSGNVAEKGFGVLVYPSGGKTFIYRYKIAGQQRLVTLGEYPSTRLRDARERYLEAALKVKAFRRGSKDGADPAMEIKAKRESHRVEEHERRKSPTVAALVADYIKRYAEVRKRSWKEDERILQKELVSRWGRVKAADIARRDIIGMVDEITAVSPSSAAQTLKIARKMFNWAVEKEIVPASPCIGVKAEPDKERTRALSDAEIAKVWEKLDSLPISDETRRALKLVLVTAQRPGEVIGMHTSEIDGRWWTIPSERSKNKRSHRVYLTRTALDLIGPLNVTDEETGDTVPKGFIFRCPHKSKEKAIEGHALPVAIRRCLESPIKDKQGKPLFGADGKPATENLLEVDPFTPHDLRRTAATLMSKGRIPLEHRERVLNHTLGKLDRIYNQHDFDDEKQIALESLERRLISITNGTATNVVPISSARKG